MKAFIKAISYYLPKKVFTNKEIAQLFPDYTIEKIALKVGIEKRHIAADDEYSSDMAYEASIKLFEEHNILPSDIDFILLCTQSPDYFLPTTACILQDRLGIPKHAGALDFNLGCSGYVYGLALAKGLISACIAKNILLITSETYSKFIHKEDKGNLTIFGDAAAASLISKDGFGEIGDFVVGTDGKGAEKLIVKGGGLRHRKAHGHSNQNEGTYNLPSECLHMDGPAIFNFTSESIPPLINQTIEKNNTSSDQISYYIFHQANRYMLNHLRKKLNIPEEKFYIYMEECGNTVSSTIPIAFYELQKQKEFISGNQIILCGFGVGYSWGSCLIKI